MGCAVGLLWFAGLSWCELVFGGCLVCCCGGLGFGFLVDLGGGVGTV